MRFMILSTGLLVAAALFWQFFAHESQLAVTCSVGAIVLGALRYVLDEIREVRARLDQAHRKESP